MFIYIFNRVNTLLKGSNKIIIVLVLLLTTKCIAQCPATIQDQGNNNAQTVTLTFNNASGTGLTTCICTVAGASGNLNCPNSCAYVVPGTGFSTITYVDAAGNSCLYDNSGNLISVLPIELLYFNANVNDNKVDLTWETASEASNNYFTVDKTKDLITFETVANITGAGNSVINKKYSCVDNNPYENVSYYRLKQTDYNGKYTYSDFREVNINPSVAFSFDVYPNPGTNETINYTIHAGKGQEVLVVVYDITGRVTYSKIVLTEESGTNVFALDPSGKLTSGIYIITATSKESINSKKLIIQ